MAAFVSRGFVLVILFSCVFSSTKAVEELVIHAPSDDVKFLSNEPIRSSNIGDIMAAMLGYTTKKIDWNSLAVVPPWKRPEAIVVLELLGFGKKVDLHVEGERFLLENSGDISAQFDEISYTTQERYIGKQSILLYMDMGGELHDSKIAQPLLLKSVPANPQKRLELALQEPELGSLIEDSTFNTSIPSDAKLLTELATVKELLKALHSQKAELHNKIPDVFWLRIAGLQTITTTYGADSFQSAEALRLLRQMITEVKDEMRSIYDDKVVIMVIKENEMPASNAFKNRKLLEASTTVAPSVVDEYNLATRWDPQFPVIFTIITLTSIMMILAVIGISLALWNMDPGRDSIIYRMTSQRIKKD